MLGECFRLDRPGVSSLTSISSLCTLASELVFQPDHPLVSTLVKRVLVHAATERLMILWAMERGVPSGFDAAVVAGKGRAVPLEVSFEAASIAFSIFVLQSRLVRRVPVTSAGVGFLEGIIPMPEFTEAIFVRVLEVREPFEEILPEFPVVDVGDRSRSDSLRWYSRSCS